MTEKFIIEPQEFAKAVLSTQNLNYANNEQGQNNVIEDSYTLYVMALERAEEHNYLLTNS